MGAWDDLRTGREEPHRAWEALAAEPHTVADVRDWLERLAPNAQRVWLHQPTRSCPGGYREPFEAIVDGCEDAPTPALCDGLPEPLAGGIAYLLARRGVLSVDAVPRRVLDEVVALLLKADGARFVELAPSQPWPREVLGDQLRAALAAGAKGALSEEAEAWLAGHDAAPAGPVLEEPPWERVTDVAAMITAVRTRRVGFPDARLARGLARVATPTTLRAGLGGTRDDILRWAASIAEVRAMDRPVVRVALGLDPVLAPSDRGGPSRAATLMALADDVLEGEGDRSWVLEWTVREVLDRACTEDGGSGPVVMNGGASLLGEADAAVSARVFGVWARYRTAVFELPEGSERILDARRGVLIPGRGPVPAAWVQRQSSFARESGSPLQDVAFEGIHHIVHTLRDRLSPEALGLLEAAAEWRLVVSWWVESRE
ncbi:MAG: hypothetical protein H6734_04070 [Alphaproteobacteria bacterium]|nr:hypothetical protein [Alphaproteobacteria bacterium]